MPFIQRNWKGEITGVFANAQPDYAEEQLPEDHPEIIAFRAAHPTPPEMLQPLTPAQIRQMEADHVRLRKEHDALRNAIWTFNSTFNELEIALSALLYAALNVPNSQVAYAIYYSPNSFDARAEIVDNVIQQLTAENPRLDELVPLWAKLYKDFRSTRTMRNKIAHGMPITLSIRGKNHARLTSPAFDTNRVGRRIRQGRIPGLTVSDIANGAKKTAWLTNRIDDVNRLLAVFYEDGNPTLPEKYRTLAEGLRTKDNR